MIPPSKPAPRRRSCSTSSPSGPSDPRWTISSRTGCMMGESLVHSFNRSIDRTRASRSWPGRHVRLASYRTVCTTHRLTTYTQRGQHRQRAHLAGRGCPVGVVPAAAPRWVLWGQAVRDCKGRWRRCRPLPDVTNPIDPLTNRGSVLELGAGMAGLAGLGIAW